MLDKVKFCEIGMGRTATRSMAKAMKILGFSVSHGGGFFRGREDLRDQYLHDLLYGVIPKYPYDNYEFVGNLPYMHWDQLAEAKPDLKFILTTRNEDDWWNGCKTRWIRVRNERVRKVLKRDSIVGREIFTMVNAFNFFGCYSMHEYRWRKAFKRYNNEILDYFKDSDRLLIHNVFEGDGWSSLCDFVGKDIPKDGYPNTKSKHITSKI